MTKENVGEEVYAYPDAEDKITTSLIMKRTSGMLQWERSENRVLDIIEEYMKKFPGSWLLDAGCGTGRLLPRFQDYFDKILAADRDPAQIKMAKDLVISHGFADKMVFETTSIEKLSWPRVSIDAILCSHLLQHINTDSVPLVLQKFRTLSKADGTLFLITTHAKNQDYFAKEYLIGKELIEEKISEEEFNSLISNKRNILPLHFFSTKSIQNTMRDSGYKLLDYRLFHIVRSGIKKKEARDILLVGKKTSNSSLSTTH